MLRIAAVPVFKPLSRMKGADGGCILRAAFNVTPLLGEPSRADSVGQDAKSPCVTPTDLFTFVLLVP